MTQQAQQRRKRQPFSIVTLLTLTAIAAALMIPARVEFGSLTKPDPSGPAVWPTLWDLVLLSARYILLTLSLLTFTQVIQSRWRGRSVGSGGILACVYGAFALTYLPMMIFAILRPNHLDWFEPDDNLIGLMVFYYGLPLLLLWLMASLWLLGFLPRRVWSRAAPWHERLALWLGLCWGAWGSYHVATLYLEHIPFWN